MVIVSVPPDILDYPTSTDMVVREGSNVTLRCAATGTPEPTVTWRREAGGTINVASNWHSTYLLSTAATTTITTYYHVRRFIGHRLSGIPSCNECRSLLQIESCTSHSVSAPPFNPSAVVVSRCFAYIERNPQLVERRATRYEAFSRSRSKHSNRKLAVSFRAD